MKHDQRTRLHYLRRGERGTAAKTGVTEHYHAQQQQQQQQQQPRILVSHSCMLIPVFFGIWWFYFRRKVSKVFSKLLVKNGDAATAGAANNNNNYHDPEANTTANAAALDVSREDEFSTWQDVMDQNSADPSVRFVRWTKTSHDFRATARRRAHQVKQTTRTTLRMAEEQFSNRTSEMATPMMDAVLLDDDISSQAPMSTVSGVFPETGTRWQCLQDVGVDGIELCALSPTI
jgi:hypothetical protein